MNKFKFRLILASFIVTSVVFTVVFQNLELFAFQGVNFQKGISEKTFEFYEPKLVKNNLVAREDVQLAWEDYKFNIAGDEIGSNYTTARRPIYYNNNNSIEKYGEWEIRGKYGTTINVLSIYPNNIASSGLESWMDELSDKNANVDINVTTQKQDDFNISPFRYLKKNNDGSYNYDVIVFGFWDEHNKARLTAESANIIQEYIDAGYGVIFGHDTVQIKTIDKGFNSLVQNNLDIFLTERNRPTWYVSNKISVSKQGSLTTFPFDINGMDLEIEMTHTVAQFPGNTVTGVPNDDIVYMTLEPNYYPNGEGPYFNYNLLTSAKGPETKVSYKLGNNPTYEYIANGYLIKQDNVAFIQAGHTSGKTSEAERMVIANIIYSLAQLSTNPVGYDQLLEDVKPSKPVDSNGDLIFEAEDKGMGYEYRIIAMPIGYDVSKIDSDDVKKALSKNVSKYSDSVVFSNSFVTNNLVSNIKGSKGYESEKDQASFRYYISKNKVGQRIPTIEIPGKENLDDDFYTLKYNEAFNFKNHYTDASKIADDDYLHVVAYDRSNNASATTSIRLKDFLTKVNVTVNYSYDGKTLKTENILAANNAELIVGSKYTSTPPQSIKIDGVKYTYSHSEPKNTIILSPKESENVINHVYNKLVTKDIYVVEVRPAINGGELTKSKSLYNTETVEVGTNIIVGNNIPDLNNQNFMYVGWSQGADADYSKFLTDKEFTWTDDNKNIYLYYEKKTASVEIDIVRSDGKGFEAGVPSYKYKMDGYVGETLTVTGRDILSKIQVKNAAAFSNRTLLQNYDKEFVLKAKDAIYKDKITLIPRTIQVVGIGITYEEEATTSSAIKVNYDGALSIDKNLFKQTRTYDQDLIVVEKAPATFADKNGGSDWKNLEDDVNGQDVTIDFSNIKDVEVTYYRGVRPEEAYNVTANYLNILDNEEIIPQYNTGIRNVANSSNVPVKDVLFVSGIVADREVEFDIEKYEVIHSTKTATYDKDVDLNDIIPFRNSHGSAVEGDYIVNIFYRPYARITHIEEVYDPTGLEVVSTRKTIYDTLYNNENKAVKPSQPMDEYSVEVSSNGRYENGKISTRVEAYENSVITKYIPLTYSLKIEVVANYEGNIDEQIIDTKLRNYDVFVFKNIPVKNPVIFTVPNYESSNFYFEDATIKKGSSADFKYDETTKKITFDPVKKPTVSGETYEMELNYRLLAELIGNYTVYRHNQKPLVEEIHGNAFVGDEILVKIPDAEKYELTKAYFDGKEYTNVETGAYYNLVVKKAVHRLDLIYREVKFLFNAEVKTEGGEVNGETEYYAGEKVYINVIPDEGYKLEKIVANGADVTIIEEEGTIGYYYFIMPEKNVSVDVYFTIDDDVDEVIIDNIGSGKPADVGSGGNDKNDDDDYVAPTEDTDKDVDKETDDKITIEDIIANIEMPKPPLKPINPTEEDILNLVNDPYYSLIRNYIVYLDGYPDGTMRPTNQITRSEVITIIYNLYSNGYVTDGKSLSKFSDVNDDDWFADAVGFAVDFGIVNGYPDGTFKPNNFITREELATIIAKFVKDDGIVSNVSHFKDVTHLWAIDSIEKLYRKNIIEGYDDSTFMPSGSAKRSEFITMINKLIGRGGNYSKNRAFPDLKEDYWAYDTMMNAANGTVLEIDLDSEILSKINK